MKASGMQCQDWGGKPIPDVLAGVAFNLPDICDYGNTSQTEAAAQVNIIVYKTWEISQRLLLPIYSRRSHSLYGLICFCHIAVHARVSQNPPLCHYLRKCVNQCLHGDSNTVGAWDLVCMSGCIQ